MARRKKKLPTEAVKTHISGLSHEGRGIAHINNKITFIRGALPDEDVFFKYTNQRAKFDEGIATEIIAASKQRVEPQCNAYGVCGGCSLQHLDSDSQIHFKQSILIEQFKHIGNIEIENLLPPMTGPVWCYRRKARLGVKFVNKKQKLLVGFRETQSNYIADIDACEILHPSIGKNISILESLLESLSIKDKIPQLEIAIGDDENAIIIRHLEAFSDQDIEILLNFEKNNNLTFYLQSGGIDTVIKLDQNSDQNLYYTIPNHDIKINFKPTDFTQINSEINYAMIDRALEFLELNENDSVLDLYCGLGNFTLPIAKYCRHATGIEGDNNLVERARANAEYNNITNTEFFTMDLADENMDIFRIGNQYNKLLLDPARSGANIILERLDLTKFESIVYISCNPATLARDSDILVNKHGFTLVTAGVMDMFPHTSHVESIAVFKQ